MSLIIISLRLRLLTLRLRIVDATMRIATRLHNEYQGGLCAQYARLRARQSLLRDPHTTCARPVLAQVSARKEAA